MRSVAADELCALVGLEGAEQRHPGTELDFHPRRRAARSGDLRPSPPDRLAARVPRDVVVLAARSRSAAAIQLFLDAKAQLNAEPLAVLIGSGSVRPQIIVGDRPPLQA
jgi:hypothetical protein